MVVGDEGLMVGVLKGQEFSCFGRWACYDEFCFGRDKSKDVLRLGLGPTTLSSCASEEEKELGRVGNSLEVGQTWHA